MLLHGAALGNKGVLAGLRGGASEAALDSGRAQGAEDLALGKHDVCAFSAGFVEWRGGAVGGFCGVVRGRRESGLGGLLRCGCESDD